MIFQIVNKKSFALFLALAVVMLTSNAASTGAQTKTAAVIKAAATAQVPAPLSVLPPSDFIAFVNVRRLINEAAPKVFADNPAKLAEFNADIDKFKTQTGIDARSFESIALGMRYQHPTPTITTTDMIVIARGTFNSGALLAAARLATQGKYQEEKYNGATVYIFKIQDQVKMLGLFKMRVGEVAATALDSNTLAIGEPQSVRATLDASKAPSRVNNDLIQLAMRSPNALMGFGANVPTSLTATADFGNAEISKIIGSIRQAYGAVSATANGFDLMTIARTEKPDQAQALSETLGALKQFGGMLVTQLPPETGKLAQTALDNLKIVATGNETSISFELRQADISTLMRVLHTKVAEAR
ncbi:MAG: hypothetical protein QOJ02_4137 [Acidobacteriota bacterium]|nr:hypothetical protein [Acidobacteriota bacterium]